MSEKPTKGKCGECQSKDLEFYDDGDGLCLDCGRIFYWDKSKDPEQEEEEFTEETEEEAFEETPLEVAPPIEGQPIPEQQYAQAPAVVPGADVVPGAAPYYPPQQQYPQQAPPQGYPPQQYPPQQQGQFPQQPVGGQFPNMMDPVTRKAWRKLEKTFKGGAGAGALGAIGAGVKYIAIPLLIYYILHMFIPADAWNELPDLTAFVDNIMMTAFMVGWLMIAVAFAMKFFRRGTPHRAIAGVGYQAAKGVFMYVLLAPFVFGLGIGDMGGMSLDYSNYITIVYILIAVTAVYCVFEYFALKNDLAAYKRGEIPEDYYPRSHRGQGGVPPVMPGQQYSPQYTAQQPYPEQYQQAPQAQGYPPQQPPAQPIQEPGQPIEELPQQPPQEAQQGMSAPVIKETTQLPVDPLEKDAQLPVDPLEKDETELPVDPLEDESTQ